ncbi:MAG TPA: RNA-guided endonuclease IscB, partial [Phototrophicaceae bacterium]|nr:RNA-guided endonuclease IscB [Phototrophicaceae bacterium]
MQRVLVLNSNKQPLMPCHPARARELLKGGKAAVYRRYPFTIILKEREGGDTQYIAFKVDPGSKQTGIALVANFQRGKRLIWAAVLEHRGEQIKGALLARRQLRRSRRSRHTRYRSARFNNRRRTEGWLPPSLQSRVDNIWTWGKRLYTLSPVNSLSMELVKFDTQLMQNVEISSMEYQQGELAGYEVREYLLEKWGRKCAYCGAKDTALEIEHITPKACGGSNRVSNLTLACHDCNQHKGTQTAAEFGHPEVQKQARQPLKDAAAINVTRWALYNRLQISGLPVEVGTGGRTKFNRTQQGYPKAHWIDAVCVGKSGEQVLLNPNQSYLHIKATGHGSHQICRTNKYGFPARYRLHQKRHFGFQTGDMVRALVPSGKYTGRHIGRVACRATGSFDLKTTAGK